MAAETQSIAQILNPLAFDIQKMSLELNCSLCLNLLTNPVLLPCVHILCKSCVPGLTSCECPVCQFQYANQDIRAAPHMESMVAIYRSLNAIFNANASQSQSHSHDAERSLEQSPTSVNVDDRSRSGQSAKDNLLMACPSHKSIKFPSEKSKSGKRVNKKVCPASAPLYIEGIIPSTFLECETSEKSRFWATSSDGPKEWVVSGQHLQNEEKSMLLKFAEKCGATVCKSWQSNVTHVIAATDEKGACIRTYKFLRAILNGKWILTVDWIRACIEANGPVNEEPYEIRLDNYDVVGTPKVGRFKAPKVGT